MYAETVVSLSQARRPMTTFALAVESVGTKAIVTICTYVVGTMGVITPEVLALRDVTSPRVQYKHPERTNPPQNVTTTAVPTIELEPTSGQNLALIRQVFKPTVLELANLFGVSRQTVYDWQSGAKPIPETESRLAKLAYAAQLFANADLRVTANTLRRKIAGGATLLEAIFAQSNVTEVSQSLIGTLQRENSQKERIAEQLAGRKRGPVNLADYGAPSLSEAS